ncbi:MAG: cadherin-like beta sandwich domain-containing protein [Prosthecobacter sp.]|uniref:RCC1 domain-containing protein n=1 Tax=Prosthecobacter sp. TaxID=1965333 RepID=UPI003BB10712
MPAIPRFYLTLLYIFLACTLPAGAATVNATWNAATDVPVTASSYTATGSTVNFTLNFAPATGTNLTVVNNTGLPFIQGTFDNLAQGQAVALSYGGVTYNYVAHYYGGTGNDLVLVWANQRLFGWGANNYGVVGDGSNSVPRFTIVPVTVTQALAGKTVVALSQSIDHSMALCSDGTVIAWGLNSYGQLGDNTTTNSYVPVAVNVTSGISALYGKTVVAIAAGSSYSMALCSDGTVATWGYNSNGELGNNTMTNQSAPVPVNTTNGVSALYGKSVVSIAAGNGHNLALCADGTLVTWGSSTFGELGNNTLGYSAVPVAVSTAAGVSALNGKTVVAIAAGGYHNLALCSDGSLSSWGNNFYGNLGNNTTTRSSVPVAVNTTSGISALFGKTLVAVAAGGYNSMGLCADGSVVAWGYNNYGQLGNNSTTDSWVPVAVNTTSGISALYGKSVVAIVTGGPTSYNSNALCSDGTLTAWGYNSLGNLGNNGTSSRSVPVMVSSGPLGSGEKFVSPASSGNTAQALVLVAEPIPTITTQAATTIGGTSATLNGTVNASNGTAVVAFDYGITTAYGSSLAATPDTVTGGSDTPVSAVPTGLTPGTIYHYRLRTAGITGADQTFTTLNNNASLTSLEPSVGTLSPVFAPDTTQYTVSLSSMMESISVTPTFADSNATAAVNGTAMTSGSGAISLRYGDNIITLAVTAQDGVTKQVYTLNVTRSIPAALAAAYTSATYVVASSHGFTATDHTVNLSLNYAPATGTNLTVVNNTDLSFISGTFDNLAQGQAVELSYNGVTYHFLANYYGGTGNDLVLVWANNRAMAWGSNSNGEAGNGTTNRNLLPVPVFTAGVLAGKTIISTSLGGSHVLALCSDGTVVAWGSNNYGQLGDNTTTSRSVPVAVNTESGVSALAGKTVVALAAGESHSLALCSDGSVVAWGSNAFGELGNNSTSNSPSSSNSNSVPVAVNMAGGVSALYGKTVVALAAGYSDSMALCSDGTVATWGFNNLGQLGDNTTTDRSVPVAVNTTSGVSALYGKNVVSVTANNSFTMALCSDGTVAAWGSNVFGRLGDNTTTNRIVPVAVNTASGISALYGKTVVAVTAGDSFAMALCSDGTLAAWGNNSFGQLGDNTTTSRSAPVAVNTASSVSALFGKTVVAVCPSSYSTMALCADGTLATWGSNSNGELGDTTTSQRNAPVLVNSTNLAAGEQWSSLPVSSRFSYHVLAVAAAPAYATVTTQAATVIGGTYATFNAAVVPAYDSMAVTFEYGTTTSYGSTISAMPSPVTGGAVTLENAAVTGLTPGTTYHFRVTGSNGSGTLNGGDQTFTTLKNNASLASLTVSSGSLSPAFDSGTTSYTLDLPYSTATLSVTPVLADTSAKIQMNSASISVGTFSLPEGGTTITTLVTAQDGTTTQAYTLTVNRATGPSLASLELDSGTLSPAFDSGTTSYSVAVSSTTSSIVLTPSLVDGTSTLKVNGTTAASGSASDAISLVYGDNAISVAATSQDGSITKTYTLLVTRGIPASFDAAFASAVTVPLTIRGLTATGSTVNLALNYKPLTGTNLTLVNNTSTSFIGGTFANLAQGQLVALSYNGISYHFLANYFGGNGNDLVLQWADTRSFAWGNNQTYQLGVQNNVNYISTPTVMIPNATLALKQILAIATGGVHTLVLCSDGTLASWGSNTNGELGNGLFATGHLPMPVDTANGTSALYGKKVVAISAGQNHSLALCSDGTVSSWGYNFYGQLGEANFPFMSTRPLAVNTDPGFSALAGKTVVAIAAGYNHSLALCSDGTLVGWGLNSSGQLGNLAGSLTFVPAVVNAANGVSALYGKTVVSIAAGGNHSLALCSDGTVVAWGANSNGQLGDGTTTTRYAGVAVSTTSGVSALYGKKVVAISAGGSHSMALCSNGTVVSWGLNSSGQLGDNTSTIQRNVPVAVTTANGISALFGKTVTGISAGYIHSVATCSDGTLAAWGSNVFGQAAVPPATSKQLAPYATPRTALPPAEMYATVVTGPASAHSLALAATPPPTVTSLSATAVTTTSVTLNGTVNASSGYITTSYDYGLTTAYGTSRVGSAAFGGSTLSTQVMLTGLAPGTTYHFRANGGTYSGNDLTFTTLSLVQSWRQTYFGTTAATGSMADVADFDNDGIPNLIEWACLLDPTTRSTTPVTTARNGANFEFNYSRSTAAANSGAAFIVEWSDTLAAGSWSSTGVTQTVLSDDGTMQQVKAVIPINGTTAKFSRLSVTAP